MILLMVDVAGIAWLSMANHNYFVFITKLMSLYLHNVLSLADY